MKLYEPRKLKRSDGNDACARLTFSKDDDRTRFAIDGNFRGKPMIAEALNPYHLVRSIENPGEDMAPLGDRLGIGYYTDPMVLSRRALDILLPHIGSFVQLVPLQFDEGDYAAVNITHVIDALDMEGSEIERFPSSGRISRVLRHVFDAGSLKDEWIFKIPQTPARAFVTYRFRQLVDQSGLTGFAFDQVWTDEVAPAVRAA